MQETITKGNDIVMYTLKLTKSPEYFPVYRYDFRSNCDSLIDSWEDLTTHYMYSNGKATTELKY